ncbi:putative nitrilase [Cladorrhinum sp. PSN332]|nr:putative nitrilase [Cladorrhinum sp. PSN332]
MATSTTPNNSNNKFKVAAAHSAPIYMNKTATLQKVIQLIEQAASEDIKLVVFPETYVPGYPYFIETTPPLLQPPILAKYADQSVVVSDDLSEVQSACLRTGVSINLGISERMKGGYTLFNSQVTIDGASGEILGVHRKLQPTYVERIVWAQGTPSTLTVHPLPALNNHNLGALACWENTMNLARQSLILQAEHVHAAGWPALSTMSGFEPVADIQIEALMKSHALTAQVFVICASNYVDATCLDWMETNLGGPQDFVKEGGGWSAVVHPFCSILNEGGKAVTGSGERLVAAEINFGDLKQVKVWLDAAGHYARPEVLEVRVDGKKYWEDERRGGRRWWKGEGKNRAGEEEKDEEGREE